MRRVATTEKDSTYFQLNAEASHFSQLWLVKAAEHVLAKALKAYDTPRSGPWVMS